MIFFFDTTLEMNQWLFLKGKLQCRMQNHICELFLLNIFLLFSKHHALFMWTIFDLWVMQIFLIVIYFIL